MAPDEGFCFEGAPDSKIRRDPSRTPFNLIYWPPLGLVTSMAPSPINLGFGDIRVVVAWI